MLDKICATLCCSKQGKLWKSKREYKEHKVIPGLEMNSSVGLIALNDYTEEKGHYLSKMHIACNVFKEAIEMEEN